MLKRHSALFLSFEPGGHKLTGSKKNQKSSLNLTRRINEKMVRLAGYVNVNIIGVRTDVNNALYFAACTRFDNSSTV